MPVKAGNYTIKQINPALALYPDDPYVTHEGDLWVKTKEYNFTTADTYSFLAEAGKSTITVEVDGEAYIFTCALA